MSDGVFFPAFLALGYNVITGLYLSFDTAVRGGHARIDKRDLDPFTAERGGNAIQVHSPLAPSNELLRGEVRQGCA